LGGIRLSQRRLHGRLSRQPANPKIETTTYQAADGRVVEARVYSVTQDGGIFRMMVADFPDAATAENAVLDHAVKTLYCATEERCRRY
jgi:hypothetical protein